MSAFLISSPRRSFHPSERKNRAASFAADFLVVLVGILSPFSIKIVGNLPIGEVIVIMCLPVLLVVRGRRLFGGGRTKLYILLALWLLSQIITDLYRGTERADWMRGQATIVFFALDLLFMTVLAQENAFRKVVFFIAFSVGSILAIQYQPTEYMASYPWKFGYSFPVTLLFLLFASFLYKFRIYLAVLILIGIPIFLDLLFNYRSPVLFLLVTTVLTLPLIPERFGRVRVLPRQGSASRVAVLAALAIGAGAVSLILLQVATAAGIAGEEAQQKNEQQFESGHGILLGARPELLVSWQAVRDSPILGHGSWAKDPKYIEMLFDITRRNGITMDLEDIEQDSRGLIPAHSHLMGAWVNAGIAGGIFWAYIFWITLKAAIKVSNRHPSLAPLYVWLLTSLLWAIIFSPFGSTVRITEAATIVIIIDELKDDEKSVKRSKLPDKVWRRSVPTRRVSMLG